MQSNELQGKVKKNTRPVVVMDIPTRIADKVLYTPKIITAFTGNPWLGTPSPTILVVQGHQDTLVDKQAIASTRVIGSAADRDVAWNVILLDLYAWKAYVQLIADGDLVNAITIILSAGFQVRHAPLNEKRILAVKAGTAPNSAILIAKAVAKRASYDWEWSLDGQVWTRFGSSTPIAKTVMTGMKPATIHFFRYRGNTTKQEGSWCDPVAFIRL